MRKSTAALTASALLTGLVVFGWVLHDRSRAAEFTFAEQADRVLNAWRQATVDVGYGQSLRLLDAPVVRPATGFRDDATDREFSDGRMTYTNMPRQTPPSGVVRYPDGATLSVPLLPADAAFAAMTGHTWTCSSGRDECLTVTGARLDTITLRSNHGPVTVPTWMFTVRELSDPVGQIAIPPPFLGTLPRLSPPDPPAGTFVGSPSQVTMSPVGVTASAPVAAGRLATRLTMWLSGSCGSAQPRPAAVEAPDAVVLGAVSSIHRHGFCPDIPDIPHPFTITLTKPLGDRVLLGAGGQPIPLEVAG